MLPTLAVVYLRIERRLSFRNLTITSFFALFCYLGIMRLLLGSSDAGWIIWLAAVSFDLIYFLTNMGFWSLAGKLCDVRQAKRLFPLIGSGEWFVMAAGGFATPWIVA